jgi:hypothetical protein
VPPQPERQDTANRPGTAGCGWLATSENNLWIQFTPSTSNVCINISGINYVSGSPNGVQSIIVESATPCSGAWTVVNCPRNNIYSSDVGSVMSHNHCFTATPGNTYYLVVDGNAGAITELYLTGISGLPNISTRNPHLLHHHMHTRRNFIELGNGYGVE